MELPVWMRSPARLKWIVAQRVDRVIPSRRRHLEERRIRYGNSAQLITFSSPPGGPADERLLSVIRLLRPVTTPDLKLVRVGGGDDGGYLMMDDFAVAGAMSIGVGPDVSWDLDVAGRGIRVALFDPTVRRLPQSVPGGKFFRVGIGPVETPDGRYQPLSTLCEMAGFSDSDELILGMDVEGAEWPSLSSLKAGDLQRFRQISLELHGLKRLNDEASAQQINLALELLAANHRPVHIHANNHDEIVQFDDYRFANTVEVTFVRKDLLSGALPTSTIATDLDGPNDRRLPDISLEGMASVPSAY